MVEFIFYRPSDGAAVADLSASVAHFEYSAGLNGDFSGEAEVEIDINDVAVNDFLKTVKENSHYLTVKFNNQRHGAIVSAISLKENIYTVEFIGFMGYMEKIIAYPSHRRISGSKTVTVKKDDRSFVKTLYADTSIGLFYGLMRELSIVMSADGYRVPFDLSAILAAISAEDFSGSTWQRTYRLNGLDLTDMRSALDDSLKEGDFVLHVGVSTSNGFRWILSPAKTHATGRSLAAGSYFDGELMPGESIARSASYVAGTDVFGNELVSRAAMDSTVAYSSHIADGKQQDVRNLQNYNLLEVQSTQNSRHQVKFSTFNDDVALNEKVTIDMDYAGQYVAVINDVSVSGTVVTYTGQVVEVEANGIIPGLRRASNAVKSLFNRGTVAKKQSNAALRRVNRGTGFRS